MDIPLDDPEANRAAAKIQAGFRGHMTRKKLKPEDKAEGEEVSGAGWGWGVAVWWVTDTHSSWSLGEEGVRVRDSTGKGVFLCAHLEPLDALRGRV